VLRKIDRLSEVAQYGGYGYVVLCDECGRTIDIVTGHDDRQLIEKGLL
jgi:hypothetical protein